jgi:anti-sigma B factor antagonist
MNLEVSTATADGAVTLAFKGDIDMSSADRFRRALDEVPAEGRLIMDLTGVDYLDSAGIKVLYDHLGRDPELIIEPGAVILRVLAITGLRDRLTIRNP